ncbi:MAG: hypothetical protein JST43_12840 [Bacteroidetes bacterium]|nr:hypothetical protein [Bacteroidota bacterium]MBS1541493.1 hypothetical protein [Bacteroidota bacterium]
MKNKKDSLEKFVEENRQHFDAYTPPENVWSKIAQSGQGKTNRFFLDAVTFWRVAAIFLLFLSGYLLVDKFYIKTTSERQDKSAWQSFNDLENYYSAQINEKMAMVSQYQSKTGLTEDEVTQNLKKLDAMYQVLKDEMKRKPTQDVRDALVLNLLVRIDLINQQLQKLDNPKAEIKKQKDV